ncbi:Integrator complex subunit 9 [Blastocladiella emersonii ATCC 22665]|nr:Integrator complex subunit 9 [Blastocladiella emersonii ATCC 22665]
MDIRALSSGATLLQCHDVRILVDTFPSNHAAAAASKPRKPSVVAGDPDVDGVDLVLVSDFMSGARLLRSLRGTALSPRAQILATRPTLDLMRRCLEKDLHSASTGRGDGISIAPDEGKELLQLMALFAAQSKIVGFDETITINSALKLCVYSSGFTIGSVNWMFHLGDRRIVFAGPSSFEETRFPEHMEIDALAFADAMVVSSVSMRPLDHWHSQLQNIENLIVEHAAEKRAALFPVSVTSPVFFDVLHAICRTLETTGLLRTSLIVVVSPVMESVAEYVNVSSEHLNADLRARTHAGLLPMLPNALADPVYAAHFMTLPSLADPLFSLRARDQNLALFVVAGHESFQHGDAVEIHRILAGLRPLTVCVTDPDAAVYWTKKREAEHRTAADDGMTVIPLDPRLNAIGLMRALDMLKPRKLLSVGQLPDTYADLLEPIQLPAAPIPHAWTSLDLPPELVRADVRPELEAALALEPAFILPDGSSLRRITCVWDMQANELAPIMSQVDHERALDQAPAKQYIGLFEFSALVKLLEQMFGNSMTRVSATEVSLPQVAVSIVHLADEGDVEIVFRHREIPQVTNALQEAMRAMFQHQFQTQ